MSKLTDKHLTQRQFKDLLSRDIFHKNKSELVKALFSNNNITTDLHIYCNEPASLYPNYTSRLTSPRKYKINRKLII